MSAYTPTKRWSASKVISVHYVPWSPSSSAAFDSTALIRRRTSQAPRLSCATRSDTSLCERASGWTSWSPKCRTRSTPRSSCKSRIRDMRALEQQHPHFIFSGTLTAIKLITLCTGTTRVSRLTVAMCELTASVITVMMLTMNMIQ